MLYLQHILDSSTELYIAFYTVYVHFLETVCARCTQIIFVSVDEALGTSAVLIASKEPQMLLRLESKRIWCHATQ